MGLLSSPATIVGPSSHHSIDGALAPLAPQGQHSEEENFRQTRGDSRSLSKQHDGSEIVSEPPGRGYRAESTQGYPFVKRQAPRAGNALAARRQAHICRAPRLAEEGAHQSLSVARSVLSTTDRAAFAALC